MCQVCVRVLREFGNVRESIQRTGLAKSVSVRDVLRQTANVVEANESLTSSSRVLKRMQMIGSVCTITQEGNEIGVKSLVVAVNRDELNFEDHVGARFVPGFVTQVVRDEHLGSVDHGCSGEKMAPSPGLQSCINSHGGATSNLVSDTTRGRQSLQLRTPQRRESNDADTAISDED